MEQELDGPSCQSTTNMLAARSLAYLIDCAVKIDQIFQQQQTAVGFLTTVTVFLFFFLLELIC
jgi:hypothetical protein